MFRNRVSEIYKLFYRSILGLEDSNRHLGRWAVLDTESRVSKKIDWANEDHCGCCVSEKQPETNPDESTPEVRI